MLTKQQVIVLLRKYSPLLVIIIFTLVARYTSYLFFHATVESLTILITFSIFLFAWHTKRFSNNSYFLFITISFLAVGFLKFIHTLTYKGMGIFPDVSANIPTQLWIAERYILSISFLISPFYINRRLNYYRLLPFYGIIVTLILLSIFHWRNFPASYIEGMGLTSFKVFSEYIISILFFISAFLLTRYKNHFDKEVYHLLILSLMLNILSELIFTLYFGVYDHSNLIGHLVVLSAYYLIYRATLEIGLSRPYISMFRELKKAEERKDDFLRFASHELKTPLTSIKLYTQILEKHAINNGYNTEIIKNISSVVDKATILVNEFLNLSKIESDQFKLSIEEFDIKELIKESITNIMNLSNKHTFILDCVDKILVQADKQYIEQVIVNLLSNAIKYSPEGGNITINVRSDSYMLEVSVRDCGVGIPKDKLNKVFDKYFRVDDAKDKANGTGLGLYISKEIIHKHGGKIRVESREGEGSSFIFTLPIYSFSSGS